MKKNKKKINFNIYDGIKKYFIINLFLSLIISLFFFYKVTVSNKYELFVDISIESNLYEIFQLNVDRHLDQIKKVSRKHIRNNIKVNNSNIVNSMKIYLGPTTEIKSLEKNIIQTRFYGINFDDKRFDEFINKIIYLSLNDYETILQNRIELSVISYNSRIDLFEKEINRYSSSIKDILSDIEEKNEGNIKKNFHANLPQDLLPPILSQNINLKIQINGLKNVIDNLDQIISFEYNLSNNKNSLPVYTSYIVFFFLLIIFSCIIAVFNIGRLILKKVN